MSRRFTSLSDDVWQEQLLKDAERRRRRQGRISACAHLLTLLVWTVFVLLFAWAASFLSVAVLHIWMRA